MIITIKEDSMGCLHLWAGSVIPTGCKYTWTVNGKWADTFIQGDEGVRLFKDELKPDDLEMLESGYAISVDYVSGEYVTSE
jgi:hypothetical protein